MGNRHATLYRDGRKHHIDTFDQRNVRGSYRQVIVGGEKAARKLFCEAVAAIMVNVGSEGDISPWR